jgi:hypothetical protein
LIYSAFLQRFAKFAREKQLVVDDGIPEISLAPTQALWALTQLGFRSGGSHLTFREYIKSLRRFGVPFSREELISGSHQRSVYRYEHPMELAVALSFRLHRILPWDVVSVLVEHRTELRSIYHRAYLERETGAGRPVRIKVGVHDHFYVKGIFLELNFCYIDDQLVCSGGPRALDAAEAIQSYVQQRPGSQIRPLLPLSKLASEIVRMARDAPPVREISKAFGISG